VPRGEVGDGHRTSFGFRVPLNGIRKAMTAFEPAGPGLRIKKPGRLTFSSWFVRRVTSSPGTDHRSLQ